MARKETPMTPEQEIKSLEETAPRVAKYWREVSEGIAELNVSNARLPCAMGKKARRKRK